MPSGSDLPSFPYGRAFNLFEAAVVENVRPISRLPTNDRTFPIELKYIAIFDQDNIFFSVTEMVFDKLFVPKQHAIFAVEKVRQTLVAPLQS